MSITMNGHDPDRDVEKMYIPNEYVKNLVTEVVTKCAVVAHRCENRGITNIGYEILQEFDIK